MSEWKEGKLGDVSKYINRGVSPVYVNNDGLNVINQKCIRNGKIDFTLSRLTSKEKKIGIEKYLEKGDILINSTGVGTAGRVAFFDQDIRTTVDSHVSIVRLDSSKVDPKYIFYYLFGMETDIETFAEGSTGQIELGRDRIREISILFPSFPEQRAIAGVLSSLDDKIDLLHRQNKTLEGIAETLWRYYFDDNRQKSWQECCVGDIADHKRQSIHPNKAPDTVFYHYSIPAFDESEMPIKELGASIQSNKYLVLGNAILFSKSNPHKDKRLWLIPENIPFDSVCSTEFQVLRPKQEERLLFLYGFLNHPSNYDEIAAGVGGTSGSHQRIDPDAIFKFPCFLPSDDILNDYNAKTKLVFNKIRCNKEQIQTLTFQRDTLLPKLMNGEIRLSSFSLE